MQLFYGTGDDMVAGPLHGSLSGSEGFPADCFESNISGTVEDITFWGFSAPYRIGMRMRTSKETIRAGLTDADDVGIDYRTVYFPFQDRSGDYTMDFFGFSSRTDSDGRIFELKLLAYNPELFAENRDVIKRANDGELDQLRAELAAVIEAQTMKDGQVVIDD